MELRKRVTPTLIFVIFILFLIALNVAVLSAQRTPLADAAYWTACSLTWSSCEVKVLYTPAIKVLSIVNGIATIGIILVLLFTFSEHILKIDLSWMRAKRRMAELKDHYIVCGYGRVGRKICDALTAAKAQFVLIDRDRELVEKLKAKGIDVIYGDVVVDPKLLEAAGGRVAKALVAALGTDADNIFLTLSAKELNPGLLIAARAHSEGAIARLRRAGARIVVLPEAVGSAQIAKELLAQTEQETEQA